MTDFVDPEVSEKSILHSLVDFRNARILEVGCGDGRLIRQYVQEATQVFGIDSDWDELRLAEDDYLKGQQSEVRLMQARAEQLPFRDKSFDLVVMGWSL
jgi:ubiquinone/menaquinone biosynthesis C-methylase UbiE